MKHRRLIASAATAVACLTLLSCSAKIPTSAPTPPAAANPADGAPVRSCSNELQTYDPLPGLTDADRQADPLVAALAERGRLIVGVVSDVQGMGARNPATGQLEGFDVDVYQDIARALLGDGMKVELRVLTQAQALEALRWESVDIVVMNYAATCGRWEQAAFSAPYLSTYQGVRTRRGNPVPAGGRICVVDGTPNRQPAWASSALGRPTITQCLTAFQAGLVDAISDDEAVLAGLGPQDPYLQKPKDPAAARLEVQHHYAVATNAGRKGLIRFVNAVLAARVADGRWQRSYDRWLAADLGPATPPSPKYGRA